MVGVGALLRALGWGTSVDRWRDLSLAARRRWCVAWQLPVLALTVALDLALAVAARGVLATPGVVGGTAIVAGVSLLALRVPPRLLMLVPIVDLLAVSFIRAETAPVIPAGGTTSALVPIACLGFHFGRVGVAWAVSGACLIGATPYLYHWWLPASGAEWIGTLALPALAVALSVIGQWTSRILDEASAERAGLHDQVARQLAITRGMLDSVDVAVAFFDTEGRVLFANQRAIEASERAGVDVRGPRYHATMVWRADRIRPVPYAEQPLQLALAGQEFRPELLWTGPPGEQVASLTSSRQVLDDDGARLGVVVVADEVTDLVESVRVRDQFLATLSHELRTPLNGIVGYLDLLSADLGEHPEHGRAIRTMRESAVTLSERISHLLLASSTGRIAVEPEQVDTIVLVEAALDRWSPEAERRGVRIEATLSSAVARVDPRLFREVVDQLVSNALKFTGAGGTVRVGLRRTDTLELDVVDTGVGMDVHEREHAFDRFYRAEASRREAVQGVGLGLSIVRAVVDAHGGEVRLISRKERGTTARVRIPL